MIGARNNFDHVILEIYGNFKGFYIEAGGNDPVNTSQTYLLDKSGWRGLVIEPLSVFNEQYKNLRSCTLENIVLVSSEYQHDTIDFMVGKSFNLISCVPKDTNKHLWYEKAWDHNIVRLPCAPLQNILDKYNISNVNVMSLDAEGYELNILKGINFSKVIFDIIAIEHGDIKECISFLSGFGYEYNKTFSEKTNSKFFIHKKCEVYEKCINRI